MKMKGQRTDTVNEKKKYAVKNKIYRDCYLYPKMFGEMIRYY